MTDLLKQIDDYNFPKCKIESDNLNMVIVDLKLKNSLTKQKF